MDLIQVLDVSNGDHGNAIAYRGNLPSLEQRHVGIVRLKQPANMGRTCQDVRLFALILCPSKEVIIVVTSRTISRHMSIAPDVLTEWDVRPNGRGSTGRK